MKLKLKRGIVRFIAWGKIILDNDTTMKAQLKHSFKKLIDEKMYRTDWPRTARGTQNIDTRMLPVRVKQPCFLVEMNHQKKLLENIYMHYQTW